jgi:uncharacterized protein YgfB (UPF0149 family)
MENEAIDKAIAKVDELESEVRALNKWVAQYCNEDGVRDARPMYLSEVDLLNEVIEQINARVIRGDDWEAPLELLKDRTAVFERLDPIASWERDLLLGIRHPQ